jgi:ectoine hydroxylase-related dioxygenase (phytanoyl-CoA dioxygenase family)
MPATSLRVEHVTPSTPVDEIIEAYNRDGVVIIEDAIDLDLIARFNAVLDEKLGYTRPGEGFEEHPQRLDFWGAKTKRLTSLAQWSDDFVEILCDPFTLQLLDRIFLAHSLDYWLNTGMLIDIGPGEKGQMLHADEGLWPDRVGPQFPENLVNCMVALSDFTAENGATNVLPGSNHWTVEEKKAVTESSEPIEGLTPAVMPIGSIAMFSGKLIHGGGPNTTTDAWRRGLSNSYCLGWLRGEEGPMIGFTEERIRELPERARYILGFGSYGDRLGKRRGGLGAFQMLDPNVVLYGGTEPAEYDLTYRNSAASY